MRAVRDVLSLFAVLAASLLLAMSPARADIDLPSVPPPQPFPLEVRVFNGESVDLSLRGVSRTGRGLRFLIRVPPQRGTLGETIVTGAVTATVRYTHNPRLGLGEDVIRYAVQAPGSGVSAPAEIRINVVERPPIFIAPKRLDFPDIPVGETATRTIELRNDGGGTLTGKLVIEAPWSFASGNGSYQLGPGQTRTFAIRFTPTEGRQYAATANFSHSPTMNLGLGGRAFDPIEIVPQKVTLDVEGGRENRTGGFTVRNLTSENRTLAITGPPQVVVQEEVTVPAKSERELALHTIAGFLEPLESELRITGGNTDLRIPLSVRAAPPRLIVDKPDGIDFGTLTAGRTGRASLTVRNIGGSDAAIRVTLPEGTVVAPDPSLESLPPGKERLYEIRVVRLEPERMNDELILHTGYAAVNLPLIAEITKSPRLSGAEGMAGATPDGSQAAPRPERTYNDIPPVESVGVTRLAKTELDLAWKKTSPNVKRYIVAEREIGFENGRAYTVWRELKDAKVRLVGSEARVTLTGRKPGERFTIAVTAMDAAGQPSRPSLPFILTTKHNDPISIPWVAIAIGAIILLGLLILRERRRVQHTMNEELERVSHL